MFKKVKNLSSELNAEELENGSIQSVEEGGPDKQNGYSSPIDDLMKEYGESQGEKVGQTSGEKIEAESAESEDSQSFRYEEPDINLKHGKAKKKRGDKKPSVDINLPASAVIRICQMALAGLISAVIKRFTYKDIPKDRFYLTESESEMIEPVVEQLMLKYFEEGQLPPEQMLLAMLAMIYAGKIISEVTNKDNA